MSVVNPILSVSSDKVNRMWIQFGGGRRYKTVI